MAKYRRSKINLDTEMDIAIGCIVSERFVRDFNLLIQNDLELLKSKYLRIVIKWSIDYFKKYNKAPNESIMNVYKAERKNIQNEDDIDLIESTLENINAKYVEGGQKFDADYIYAQVELYIKGRALEENANQVKGLVSIGKIAEAEKGQKSFKRKEKNNTSGTRAFTDMNAVEDMFNFEKSIVDIPGALGELLQEIYKGDLVFPSALSKRGKTWFLIQLAIWASQQGLKVAFFTFEMNSKLINRRLAQTLMGKSFKEIKDKKYVPEFDKNNNIVYKKQRIKRLTERDVKRSYKMMDRQCGNGGIWFYDSTTGGRTIDAIKNTIITASEHEGNDFDIVLIDQLSLIQGGRGNQKRLQLDDIAVRLKSEICEEMQIPVVTPLQFNKEASKTNQGGAFNLNEASSLFHHASLLININNSFEERDRGIARITCEGRHNNYSGEVVILQNMDMGRYVLDSRWKRDIPNYNEVICESSYSEEDLEDLEDV